MRDEVEGAEDEEEYYYSYDQFHSLPDEVLHLILSKLSDPKSLLRSSLVSHRFASILYNSSSLSLQIPSSPILPTNHLNLPSSNPNYHLSTRILRFLTNPFRFLHHFLSPPSPSDLHSDDALLFTLSKLLQRFHNLRSLRVEFPCSCHSSNIIKFGYSSSHDSASFKWKTKLGLKIDTFTILLPTSLCKINEETDREEEEESEPPVLDWLNRGYGKAFWPMYYAFSMHRVLLLLVVKYPRLRSVVITDSKKQGRLVLQGEELVALRNLLVLSPKMLESIVLPQHVKLWYVPELKLPLSGYLMKRVTLMAFKGVYNNPVGGGGDDDADVRAGGFEDDENGIFGEAVMEILSNYKDSLKLSL